MVDETEFQNIHFLEQVKFEMGKNADLIKERTPETLSANFNNAMDSLINYYFSLRNQERRFPFLPLRRERVLKGLDKKTRRFNAFFSETVFSKLVHASDKDLPEDENDLVILKSLERVTSDKVLQTKDVTKHQGKTDEMIGSNGLVFANSIALPSRSFSGKYAYQIDSSNACVVPLDIADLLSPARIDEEKYGDALNIFFISRNIFSANDFEIFFSTYCAVVFESPQEALNFFRNNYFLPQQAGIWSSEEETLKNVHNEKDKATILNIRKLYVVNGIIPPFSPEWQFKGEVKAKKIDKKTLML